MGEVWRARDTRLERQVAIKVLPPDLANDSQLKRRFEREAQTVSQLAHPNICTLFDVGENYLVMELLEGETLADRLARGPLPFEEVIRYGIQIADALDKAHRQHVIHRDLKPGNIMLTKGGAKLLDFGLAKSDRGILDLSGKSASKTLTQEGTILGTFQYMAPEQLEGGKADTRTDIFAFGAVLYEMVTGKPAFDAASNMSLIAKIVAGEPHPISRIQPSVPPALERVITKCLAKDPDDRWQSAHDIGDELRWIATAGPHAGITTVSRVKQWARRGAMAAGWIFAAAALAAAVWFARHGADRRPLTAEVQAPRAVDFAHQGLGAPAISPDGSRLAFLIAGDNPSVARGILVRDLATGSSKVLDGTTGAAHPFWSPDGKFIAFFAERKLKAMNIDDGASRVVCEALGGRGGSWSATGTIIFTPDVEQPLFRVAAGGGKAVPLTKLPGPHWSHRLPSFLPDGDHFVFVERSSEATYGRIAVASLSNPASKVLIEHGSNVSYANGYLIYVSEGTLVAQPFDAGTLQLAGDPITIADNIWYHNSRDVGYAAASGNVLVYRREPNQLRQIGIVDRSGREVATFGDPGPVTLLDLSADRRWALTVQGSDAAGRDVWLLDVTRGAMTRATFEETKNTMTAVCSHDCSRIAVTVWGGSADAAKSTVWIQPQSGGSASRETLPVDKPFIVIDWSVDDRYIIGVYQQPNRGWDVGYIDLAQKPRSITPLLTGKYDENAPRISPDGRWLTYYSNEAGAPRLYLTPFPSLERKWQVAEMEAFAAEWMPDGSELILREPNDTKQVHSVAVDLSGPEPKVARPVDLPIRRYGSVRPIDRDHFVWQRDITTAPEPLRMVVNWPTLLTPER